MTKPVAAPLQNKIICIQDDPNSTFVVHWIKRFIPEDFQLLRAKYVGEGMFQSNTIKMTLPCNQFPLVVTQQGIAYPGLSSFHWLWTHVQDPKFKTLISKDQLHEALELMKEFLEDIQFFDPNTFDQEFTSLQQQKQAPVAPPPKQSISPSSTVVRVPSSSGPKTQHITKGISREPSLDDHRKIAESDQEDGEEGEEDAVSDDSHESGESQEEQVGTLKHGLTRSKSAMEWREKADRKKGRKVDPEILKENEEELKAFMAHQEKIKESIESKGKSKNRKVVEPPVPQPRPRQKKAGPTPDEIEETKTKVEEQRNPIKKKNRKVKMVRKKTALEYSKERPRIRNPTLTQVEIE